MTKLENLAARPSRILLEYYDLHLLTHGDTARGAAWPDEAGRQRRFQVGLQLILEHLGRDPLAQPVRICDLACGTGEFYRYLCEHAPGRFSYVGIDLSAAAIGLARAKFPGVAFHCVDFEACGDAELDTLLDCDFVFASGLLTVRHTAAYEDMWAFMEGMLQRVWPRARRGVIFNVMSKAVDWEREDLFHVSYDALARLLHALAGRWIGFRADYGLHEFMAYALKPPLEPATAAALPASPQE